METNLNKIEEVSDEEMDEESINYSVQKQLKIFEESALYMYDDQLSIMQDDIKAASESIEESELEESVESLTSSDSENSVWDSATEKRMLFLANKNIRETLRDFNNYKSKIINKKRRATLLNDALERKSVLANRRATVHAKAIDRIFNRKHKPVLHDEITGTVRKVTFSLAFLVVLNIFLAVIDIEINLTNIKSIVEANAHLNFEDFSFLIEEQEIDWVSLSIRVLNGILSCGQIWLLTAYYSNILRLRKIELVYSGYDNIYTTGLWKYYYGEVLVLVITPSPVGDYFFNYSTESSKIIYSLNILTNLLVFAKVYIFFRVYCLLSNWFSKVSRNLCENSGVTFDLLFVLKAETNKRPFFIFFLGLTLIVLVEAYFLRITSFLRFVKGHDFSLSLREGYNIITFIYLTVNTLTMVGSGDVYPQGVLAKLTAVMTMITGLLLFSYFCAILHINLKFIPEERNAYLTIKRLDAYEEVEKKASGVIYSIIMLNYVKRSKLESMEQSRFAHIFFHLTLIKMNISLYYKAVANSKQIEQPKEESIAILEQKVRENADKLQNNIYLIDTFSVKIKNDYKNIFELYHRIKGVVGGTHKLGKLI